MTIDDYLEAIKYAASELLRLIWADYEELHRLKCQICKLEREFKTYTNRANELANNPIDDDDIMMATQSHWIAYDIGGELRSVTDTKENLESQQAVKDFSIAALSGAVLQYAKQAIIIVGTGNNPREKLSNCLDETHAYGEPLKNWFWHGRVQTNHFDESLRNKDTIAFFERIGKQIPIFMEYKDKNLAFEIIKAINIRNFNDFSESLKRLF